MRLSTAFNIDSFGGAVVPSDAAWFPSPFDHTGGRSAINITGAAQANLFFGKLADNTQRQVNLVDNLSVVIGSHQTKFGIDYRRLYPTNEVNPYSVAATFNGIGLTTGGATPAAGSLLSGRARTSNITTQDKLTVISNSFSAYGQDTWKVGRRLTLTYGVRWDVSPPPHADNTLGVFTVINLDTPASITLAPQGTPLYQTTYNNFGPRVGLAYQLSATKNRETVLRGGFGVFYDDGTGRPSDSPSFFPYSRTKSLPLNTIYPFTDPSLALPAPFSLTPVNASVLAFPPDLKLPKTYEWNFAVQQSLGTAQTLTASYVGAVGRRLIRSEALSSSNASFAAVTVLQNLSTSSYHALQLQLNRRLSRGLQGIASYTWSHSIDNASDDVNFNTRSDQFDPTLDRGSSDFDVRHSFSGALTYNVPKLKSGMLGSVVPRDWSVDAIFNARSATPVNVISASFLIINGKVVIGQFRPDLITGVPLYLSDPNVAGGKRINPAAFASVSTARQGNLGRNSLRGFPVSQIDFALQRKINLPERLNILFRAELFNAFNHPNFADPNSDLTVPSTFGQSTQMLGRSLGSGGLAGGLNPLYQIGGPRSIQFAIMLQF